MEPTEEHYEQAYTESQEDRMKPGVYAKCLAAQLGDATKAKAQYIEERAKQLANEQEAREQEVAKQQALEEESRRLAEAEAARLVLEEEIRLKEEQAQKEEEERNERQSAANVEAEKAEEEARLAEKRLAIEENRILANDKPIWKKNVTSVLHAGFVTGPDGIGFQHVPARKLSLCIFVDGKRSRVKRSRLGVDVVDTSDAWHKILLNGESKGEVVATSAGKQRKIRWREGFGKIDVSIYPAGDAPGGVSLAKLREDAAEARKAAKAARDKANEYLPKALDEDEANNTEALHSVESEAVVQAEDDSSNASLQQHDPDSITKVSKGADDHGDGVDKRIQLLVFFIVACIGAVATGVDLSGPVTEQELYGVAGYLFAGAILALICAGILVAMKRPFLQSFANSYSVWVVIQIIAAIGSRMVTA